jgi:hypothetical protein
MRLFYQIVYFFFKYFWNHTMVYINMFYNAIIPFALLYNIKAFLICVLAFVIEIGLT